MIFVWGLKCSNKDWAFVGPFVVPFAILSLALIFQVPSIIDSEMDELQKPSAPSFTSSFELSAISLLYPL